MKILTDFLWLKQTEKTTRYKMITAEWQLLKDVGFWALIHRANNCNGYVAGSNSKTTPKQKNCSGCGRRVDRNLLNKLPFLIKMDLVNNAWRPNATDTSSS